MPRHALRSELAAKLTDGWTGPAGRHVIDTEMPSPTGVARRHALASEVEGIVTGPQTPTFRTSIQNRQTANIANTVGAMTGVQTGDILIAIAGGSSSTSTLTPPSGLGWTLIGDTSGVDASRLRAYATTATSADQAGGTWTWNASGAHWVGIVAYDHAALPTSASLVRNNGFATIDAPSQTSTVANSMLLTFAYWFNNGTTPTWPGTMTARITTGSTTTSGSAAEELLPTAQASGTRTLTVGAAPSSFSAGSLLLGPG